MSAPEPLVRKAQEAWVYYHSYKCCTAEHVRNFKAWLIAERMSDARSRVLKSHMDLLKMMEACVISETGVFP